MITMIVVIFDKKIGLFCRLTRAVIILKKQDVFHRAMIALDFTLEDIFPDVQEPPPKGR